MRDSNLNSVSVTGTVNVVFSPESTLSKTKMYSVISEFLDSHGSLLQITVNALIVKLVAVKATGAAVGTEIYNIIDLTEAFKLYVG